MISSDTKKMGVFGVFCLIFASLGRYYVTNILGLWALAWSGQGLWLELVLPGGVVSFFLWHIGVLCVFVGVPMGYFLDNYSIVREVATNQNLKRGGETG